MDFIVYNVTLVLLPAGGTVSTRYRNEPNALILFLLKEIVA